VTGRQVTPERAWRPWLASPELRPFPDAHPDRVVVVAAHSDDQTLAASGLLQRLHDDGTSVELVIATDGADRCDRAAVGESLRAQGLSDIRVRWLGLPVATLAEHHDELVALLAELLAGAEMCLAPWPDDPHPDHRVVGAAVGCAAPVTTHRWSYPVWMWHRMRPADPGVPQDRAYVYRLTEPQRRRKAAGIAAFADRSWADPILDTEILFRQPPIRTAPIERFRELYAAATDPWATATKWYERRKRAIALAALPCERYGFAVEPACGTGELTRALADRCDRVLAFDPVPAAVRQTRAATAGRPHVEIRQAELPAGLPEGPVDLVVFSEILYYLDDHDLRGTVDRAVAALRPGGHVLAVHWRPWAAEAPRDGVAAHRGLLARPEFDLVVDHGEEEFVLHVLVRR
jgi:LmbE family N-acetylglucosaminyl deacetylase